jgi:hypothetical protein
MPLRRADDLLVLALDDVAGDRRAVDPARAGAAEGAVEMLEPPAGLLEVAGARRLVVREEIRPELVIGDTGERAMTGCLSVTRASWSLSSCLATSRSSD